MRKSVNLISKRKTLLWLALILVLAALALRLYKVDQFPNSLYYDEVDLGYQARSLVETFKDYRGVLTPFYVLSFNDPRVPIPAYLTAISTLLFSKEEFQVRMPGVVIGTFGVLLVFLLTKIWTNNWLAAFLAGLVLATSPWHIQNSRWAHEGVYSVTFFTLSLWLFFKSLSQKSYRWLVVSMVAFSLTVFTYRAMGLFIPLSLAVIGLIYRKELLWFGIKRLAGLVGIFASVVLPFVYSTTLAAPDIPRIAQVSIFSDKALPIWVQRYREIDSGDLQDKTIGKKARPESFIFHNKPLSYLTSFTNNYLQAFSSDFLFINGSYNPRESVRQMGVLFYIDIAALLIGIYFVVNNLKAKHYQLLMALLLIAPIPASLTVDGARHGSRLFILSVPLLITVGLGWWRILTAIKNLKFSKIIYAVVAIVWVFSMSLYLHNYYVHYPIETANDFGYGFKQAMLSVVKESPNYKTVQMSTSNDPPIIYYLFWSHTKPQDLQEYGSEFDMEKNFGKPLDKFKAVPLKIHSEQYLNMAELLEPDVLYLFGYKDLPILIKEESEAPQGVRILEIIKYPNNNPAFYLVTREVP